MKRTKRYGGFLVGDRVRVKSKNYEWLKEGEITGLVDGYCSVYFTENTKMLGEPVVFAFMPNQLINLTRQEEEREDIIFGCSKENALDFLKSVEEESKCLEEVKKEMFAKYLLANIEAMVEETIERGKYIFCKAISNEINSFKLPPKPITFSLSDLPDTPLELL